MDLQTDFYDDLPQYIKDSIEVGLKQIEAGEVYEQEEVMQDIKTKYGISN